MININEPPEISKDILPPEKSTQNGGSAQNQIEEKSSPFIALLNNISGINTKIALKRVSGVEKMYRGTLEVFYNKLISDCESMENFIGKKDLHSFSIAVHGIKSSLSTIGAMGMSETAAALESASKDGELFYCEEKLPEFLTKLRQLHRELTPVFPESTNAEQRSEGSGEFLKAKLEEAYTAAEDFDDKMGLAVLSELLEFSYGNETDTALKQAYSAMKNFDYDIALEIFDTLRT